MKTVLEKWQISHLFVAIQSMDGRQEVVRDGEKYIGMITHPYDLAGEAIYALARTGESLRPVVIAIEKARKAMGDSEFSELMMATEEVDIFRIALDSLRISDNRIPPSILAGLLPMLAE